MPTQDIIYVLNAAAFAFTGDVQAFIASYGNANLAVSSSVSRRLAAVADGMMHF